MEGEALTLLMCFTTFAYDVTMLNAKPIAPKSMNETFSGISPSSLITGKGEEEVKGGR